MKKTKRLYVPPYIEVVRVEMEEGIASASITPHIEADNKVTEEWEEEEIIFEKVEW